LKTNANKSFLGPKVYGAGFTFDDSNTDGVANTLAMMHDLIARDPRHMFTAPVAYVVSHADGSTLKGPMSLDFSALALTACLT